MELLLKVVFLLLSALFAGVVLFLSTVLRTTFNALNLEQYRAVFANIIVAGRASTAINILVLTPLALFAIYLLCGYRDGLFVAGALCYIAGSFVASVAINEPLYRQLLRAEATEVKEMTRLRRLLNGANLIRATFSLAGSMLVGLSIASEFAA